MPTDVNFRRGWMMLISAGLGVLACAKPIVSAAAPPPLQQQGAKDQAAQDHQFHSRQQRETDRQRQRERPPAAAQPAPPPAPTPSSKSDQQVVARVNGREITMQQLQQPLIEGYGLTVLLNLVQLELAKEAARSANVTVAPEDLAQEREQTLSRLFPDADKSDHEALFEQFLEQQRVSRAEFNILLQTNAHLRKVIEPQVRGKVTEENLKVAYNQTYGETVQVRHIQLTNLTEVADAKRRLAEGEPFERVAQAMSLNPRTGPLGGELPPFSRAATHFPQAFRDAAFTLRVGEVSDPVQADGFYHLIKLEKRTEPKVVAFENVKESLRQDLEDRLIQQGINQLRIELGQEAMKSLRIEEPVLREQYQRKRDETAAPAPVKEEVDVRQELQQRLQRIREQQRQADDQTPTTPPPAAPATEPAAGPEQP